MEKRTTIAPIEGFTRQLLAFLFVITLVPQSLLGQQVASDALEERIDQLMMDYDGQNLPGAAVAIYDLRGTIFQKNYGLRDLEANAAVTNFTNFRTASLSKAFTATAILQLAEQGKLELDDRLTDIFKSFPSYGSKISVHHLLSHTSGLLDYENLLPNNGNRQVTDQDVLTIMTQQRSTYFTPGTRFRYSNTGYAVLAEIVKTKSGMSFHDYLDANIFKPLGMLHTVAFVEGMNSVTDRAYGYSLLTSGYKRTDQSRTSAVLGDGGVYSSSHDYLMWHLMWNGGPSVLSMQSQNVMTTPKTLANGSSTGYGYGWFIDKLEGLRRISHTGSTIGQKHAIAMFPDKGISILILTNRENSAPWLIVDKIAKFILNQH